MPPAILLVMTDGSPRGTTVGAGRNGLRAEVRLRYWHPGTWRLLWKAIGGLLPARLKLLAVARVVASELARPAETWLMARGVATKGTVRRAEQRAERGAVPDHG